MRSQVSAYENSLGSNMDYLDKYSESLHGARSRIQDIDVATESPETSRAHPTAICSNNAYTTPQIALNLLP